MDGVPIFWTGGWDSTFRVIQLARLTTLRIEPHYVISVDRPGMVQELMALARLREGIGCRYPDAAARIAPLNVFLRSNIDAELVADCDRRLRLLCKRLPLGPQYAWLAAYVEQQDLRGVELCLQGEEMLANLRDNLSSFEDENGVSHEIARDCTDEGVRLFSRFRFPLLGVSKVEMREIAEREGFLDLMGMTWFCHKPTRAGYACGLCAPCRQTMQELESRVPVWNRYYGPPLRNRLLHAWYWPLRVAKETDWERGLVGRVWRRMKGKG